MKKHGNGWCAGVVVIAAGLLGCSAQIALAGDPCVYEGSKYSDGAASCQAGAQYRCIDGAWNAQRIACTDQVASNKTCELAGISYSLGSASCQSGTQFRCDGGAWTSLAVPCSAGDSPIRIVPGGRTCMFNDATVSSNSTICKAGTTMLCSNGEWVNLGMLCR